MYDKETLLETVAFAVAVAKDLKDGCDETRPNYWTGVKMVLSDLAQDGETALELLSELKRLK